MRGPTYAVVAVLGAHLLGVNATSVITTAPSPHTRFVGDMADWAQRVVADSEVPTPPTTVQLHRGHCPPVSTDVLGCWSPHDIWVRDREPFELMHELGHEFDAVMLTDADRAYFERLIAIVGDWWDWDLWVQPGEVFADDYARCALGMDPRWSGWFSYGWMPTLREYRRICAHLRYVGSR